MKAHHGDGILIVAWKIQRSTINGLACEDKEAGPFISGTEHYSCRALSTIQACKYIEPDDAKVIRKIKRRIHDRRRECISRRGVFWIVKRSMLRVRQLTVGGTVKTTKTPQCQYKRTYWDSKRQCASKQRMMVCRAGQGVEPPESADEDARSELRLLLDLIVQCVCFVLGFSWC